LEDALSTAVACTDLSNPKSTLVFGATPVGSNRSPARLFTTLAGGESNIVQGSIPAVHGCKPGPASLFVTFDSTSPMLGKPTWQGSITIEIPIRIGDPDSLVIRSSRGAKDR